MDVGNVGSVIHSRRLPGSISRILFIPRAFSTRTYRRRLFDLKPKGARPGGRVRESECALGLDQARRATRLPESERAGWFRRVFGRTGGTSPAIEPINETGVFFNGARVLPVCYAVQEMRAISRVILMTAMLPLLSCCSTSRRSVEPQPPGGVVRVGGRDLYFRQSGSGPNVLLLHGLGDSSLGWKFIEPALIDAGYRVTDWDALAPGDPKSPPGITALTLTSNDWPKCWMSSRFRHAVLVGHSLGGSVALRMAEQHPDKVIALCLIDPGAYRAGAMGGRWFWDTPLIAEAVLGLLPSRTLVTLALDRNLHNHAAIPKELRRAYVREAKRHGATAALIAQERQLVPQDPEKWEQAHRAIRQRTLILWGGEDRLVSPAQGKRLARDIDGSTLIVLSGVGHSPHLEAPQRVLDPMLAFLEDVAPR